MTFEIPAGFVPVERRPGPFAAMIGPFYARLEDRPARFGVRLTEAHTNLRGVCHGGMLMAFTDHMLGYTILEELDAEPLATLSLNCEFVRAGMPGDWIEGTAEIVRITRSIVFIRGTLRRGADIVLTANGVWKRLGKA